MTPFRDLFGALADIWKFTRQGGKYALFFLALVLLLMGGVILLAERTAIMPFIYTIF